MVDRDVDVPSEDHVALDVLSLLSRKWHPVVVVVLDRHGPMGFNALLEAIPDVSGKVLSGTLEALTDAGLIRRSVISESPLRVEYELTEAGRDMQPIFETLTEWGQRHLESATPGVLLADGDRRITEMYGQWLADQYTVYRAHNGEELEESLYERIDVVLFDEGLLGVDPRVVPDIVGSERRTIVLVGDRPDLDLLEIDCDDVLRKPIVRETALEAIGEQLRRQTEPPEQRQLSALEARLSLLESVYPVERLETNKSYLEARDRLDTLEESSE